MFIVLPQLVGTRFQVLFHSPPGVLFTIPSRYFCTIGHRMCLALRDGPRGFRPGCTCPNVLRVLQGPLWLSRTGLSPSTVRFPADSASLQGAPWLSWFAVQALQPPRRNGQSLTRRGFGLFPFRSPLLRESSFLSLLRVLRCFTSPADLCPSYVFRWEYPPCGGWVSPFGNPRIKACWRLPEAYRS